MKITFLGTGTSQGVPVIGCRCEVCLSSNSKDKRLRSSIHVEVQGKSFIVDTGPDFRQQVLREEIIQLDAVLYTHEHRDHTAGLDDIRSFNFLQGKAIDLYARPQVQEALKQAFAYIFEEHKYPGIPKVDLYDIPAEPFEIEGIKIIPIEVMHYKLPVLGFRFGDFTYLTDVNYISHKEKEKIYGTKILVLDALRVEEHISHFNLAEAVELAKEFGAQETYFTHISHQLGLHDEVEAELPPGIFLSYDGLRVEL